MIAVSDVRPFFNLVSASGVFLVHLTAAMRDSDFQAGVLSRGNSDQFWLAMWSLADSLRDVRDWSFVFESLESGSFCSGIHFRSICDRIREIQKGVEAVVKAIRQGDFCQEPERFSSRSVERVCLEIQNHSQSCLDVIAKIKK